MLIPCCLLSFLQRHSATGTACTACRSAGASAAFLIADEGSDAHEYYQNNCDHHYQIGNVDAFHVTLP